MPLILIATRERDEAQRYCAQARSADPLSISHDPATAAVSRSAAAMRRSQPGCLVPRVRRVWRPPTWAPPRDQILIDTVSAHPD
jgi:hypothetical protein